MTRSTIVTIQAVAAYLIGGARKRPRAHAKGINTVEIAVICAVVLVVAGLLVLAITQLAKTKIAAMH